MVITIIFQFLCILALLLLYVNSSKKCDEFEKDCNRYRGHFKILEKDYTDLLIELGLEENKLEALKLENDKLKTKLELMTKNNKNLNKKVVKLKNAIKL